MSTLRSRVSLTFALLLLAAAVAVNGVARFYTTAPSLDCRPAMERKQ